MNFKLVGLLAYLSLLASGVSFVLDFMGVGSGILSIIAYGLLLIVVLWCAWEYSKKLKQIWRIVYIIIAILAVVGFVFGGFKLF